LRLKPDEIPEGGLDLDYELGPEGTADEFLAPTRLESPLQVRLKVEPVEQGFLFRGRVSGRLSVDCRRCLKPFDQDLDLEVEVFTAPDPSGLPEETQLRAADLDVSFFKDRIDVDQLVLDQIELSRPMTDLCDPDCRGICSGCGADLNQGPCACPSRPSDSRWDVLKQWRPDK
jgi:uncharacterized protein